MPNKNEAASQKAERLQRPEPKAEAAGANPSLRVFQKERSELMKFADAVSQTLAKKNQMLGLPDKDFDRGIVDKLDGELREMASRLEVGLNNLHELDYSPRPKGWNENHEADLRDTIKQATEAMDKAQGLNDDRRMHSALVSAKNKLRGQEMEAMADTKNERFDLTEQIKRSKAAFAGKYKISYDRALVLATAPTGWLGRLADRLAGNNTITNDKELALAKRLKTSEAATDMNNVKKLLEQANALWAKAHNAEKGSTSAPDMLVSPDTIREVVMGQHADKPEEERKRLADEAIADLQNLSRVDWQADVEIEKQRPTLRTEDRMPASQPKPEPEATDENKPAKDADDKLEKTVHLAKAEVERIERDEMQSKSVDASIKAFGGGDKGREYAAKLWDEIQGVINLNMGNEEIDFSALDYVKTVADRDLAAKTKDHAMENAAKVQLAAWNKALGYPKGMDPSTGIGMGSSRLTETKALGSNTARSEAAKNIDKQYSVISKEKSTVKEQPVKKEKASEVLTVNWAAEQLKPLDAKLVWDQAMWLMSAANKLEDAKKVVSTRTAELVAKLTSLANQGAISLPYRESAKLMAQAGDPTEATILVMLRALSNYSPVNELNQPIYPLDREAIKETRLALGDIYRELSYLNTPIKKRLDEAAKKNKANNASKKNQAAA